ncbi:hypothetical protein [Caulobacter sp. 17J80-11]|uniref:hypothetical protein n=1 Tax=Caulobacter sp. 17J80-11 TaxID=2763502 RepID=UPI00165392B3|nr:hypothetical protein [Caulobacter sp. 17J80-11]MBC6982166.1 hypothetical protein [Caulobacter sp. 17J80-11]
MAEHASRLADLARSKPNSDAWAYVAEMLASKHEGLRAGAVNVLGAWGGERPSKLLAEELSRAFSIAHAWSLRGVIVGALRAHVRGADADWVLDLYFSRPDALQKHELLPLVVALPPADARPRLVKELAS